MPLIPEYCLYCTVHVFPDAEEDPETGGTGFIVAYPSQALPEKGDLYIVTAGHILESATRPTVRLNRIGGDTVSMPAPLEDWIPHPGDGDIHVDIAVYPFESPPDAEWECIEIDECLWDRIAREQGIGPGDDVFMVGRYLDYYDEKLMNTPSVRFGNISRMPLEKMTDEKGRAHLSYLVEMRSIPGFSGSPVFVWMPPFSARPGREERPLPTYQGPWLLGVDWGHLPRFDPLINIDDPELKSRDWMTRSSSALAAVEPAWRLTELLESPDLRAVRDAKEKERQEKKKRGMRRD